MKLAVRTVELNRAGHYLKLDYTGSAYRVAFYWPKRERGKIVGENRAAIERRSLYDALTCVFAEAADAGAVDFDARTVETYMRSTRWGRELP